MKCLTWRTRHYRSHIVAVTMTDRSPRPCHSWPVSTPGMCSSPPSVGLQLHSGILWRPLQPARYAHDRMTPRYAHDRMTPRYAHDHTAYVSVLIEWSELFEPLVRHFTTLVIPLLASTTLMIHPSLSSRDQEQSKPGQHLIGAEFPIPCSLWQSDTSNCYYFWPYLEPGPSPNPITSPIR